MFKNTAAKFMVFAFDTTNNTAKTGDAANITCYVTKDYGTVTVLADTSATEMDSTNAKGYYLFDAAQGETNGDCLMISAKSATANIAVIGAPAVIYTRPTTNWLAPATLNRTLAVDASGRALADVDTIKTNPVVNGGTITFPTTATLASTTNITSATGVDITKILGTTISTPATAGILDVNVKNMNNVAGTAITTIKAVQGLTTADTITTYTGNTVQTGDSFARIGVAGAGLTAITGVTLAAGQKVDVDTIKTNPVVNAGTVTFPTTATLASTTNITAGTVTTVTNLTNAPTAGDFTATMKTSLNAATPAVTVSDKTGFSLTAAYDAAKTAAQASDIPSANITAIKAKTDSLTFTVANKVDANARSMNGTTIKGTGISTDLWRG